jgi:hypothetical protein
MSIIVMNNELVENNQLLSRRPKGRKEEDL